MLEPLTLGNSSEELSEQKEKSDLTWDPNLNAYYFSEYGSIEMHQSMVEDYTRTNTYRVAILKNHELLRGKVVLDLGCGTGILSIFCAQAGAKKVYAVDASKIVHVAKEVVKLNGYQDRIEVIHGRMEEVALPEKVDIIVSEWMGYMLFLELMLLSVLNARDKWLKPEGYMFPSTATLFMAPMNDSENFDHGFSFWEKTKSLYNVDMSCVSIIARKKHMEMVHVLCVPPENIQSHAVRVCDLDLTSASLDSVMLVESPFTFRCFGHTMIHAFVFWFEVTFPKGISLSTSPYKDQPETHWEQSVLYVEPFQVEQDTLISGHLTLNQSSKGSRYFDVGLRYAVNGGEIMQRVYRMDDSEYCAKIKGSRKIVNPDD